MDLNGDTDDDLCDAIQASMKTLQAKKRQRLDDQEEVIRIEAVRKQAEGFRHRKWEGRPPYDMSTWGRMLVNPRTKDPVDRKGECYFDDVFEFLFHCLKGLWK